MATETKTHPWATRKMPLTPQEVEIIRCMRRARLHANSQNRAVANALYHRVKDLYKKYITTKEG